MKTEQKLFEEWYVANYHDGDIFPHNRVLDFNDHHGEYRDNLVNALWEAWQASTSRDGYKFVPTEPTEEMLDASRRRQWDDLSSPYEDMDMLKYKAMIGAYKNDQ